MGPVNHRDKSVHCAALFFFMFSPSTGRPLSASKVRPLVQKNEFGIRILIRGSRKRVWHKDSHWRVQKNEFGTRILIRGSRKHEFGIRILIRGSRKTTLAYIRLLFLFLSVHWAAYTLRNKKEFRPGSQRGWYNIVWK